jgi:hypothetical protein
VVYGDEPGTGAICERLGLNHFPQCPRDEFGLPLLNFMFTATEAFAETPFLCYSNADIMIVNGLAETAEKLGIAFPNGFLGVCRRWDVDLTEAQNFFDSGWRDSMSLLAARPGSELYTPCSSDLFLFTKPLGFALQQFTAGRPRWDNWMMWAACDIGLPVVDMTEAVFLIHSRHLYGESQNENRKSFFKHKSSGRNQELAGDKLFCLNQVRRAGNLWTLTTLGDLEKN